MLARMDRRWGADAQQPLLKLRILQARVHLRRGRKGVSPVPFSDSPSSRQFLSCPLEARPPERVSQLRSVLRVTAESSSEGSYVESLETRLEKMEKLLNKVRPRRPRLAALPARTCRDLTPAQLCPNADFTKELGGSFDKDAWLGDRNGEPSSATTAKPGYGIPTAPSQPSVIGSPPTLGTPASQVDSDDLDPSDDEIVAQRNIVQSLRKMSMNPSSMRYHGKSSSLLFIQTAMDLKQEYAGVELPKTVDPEAHTTLLRRRQQQYWSLHPVRVFIDSIFTYGEARLTMLFPLPFLASVLPRHPRSVCALFLLRFSG